MNQPPAGWPRISSAVFYEDAAAAIPRLCRTFGFDVRLKFEGEGGRIEHSELGFGESGAASSSASSSPSCSRRRTCTWG